MRDFLESLGRPRRRRLQKAAQEGLASFVHNGLPFQPDDPTAAATLAAMLSTILNRNKGASARHLAATTAEIFDASMRGRDPTKLDVDCKKGCAFCCKIFVTASAPEIFLSTSLAVKKGLSRDKISEISRLRSDTRAIIGLHGCPNTMIDCSMLSNNVCEIYSDRPIACRGYASRSSKSCELSLTDESVEVETPYGYGYFSSTCKIAIYVALRLRGYPYVSYEFNQAVDRCFSIEGAESKWLDHEDIFRDVQTDPMRNSEMEALLATVERMAIAQIKKIV